MYLYREEDYSSIYTRGRKKAKGNSKEKPICDSHPSSTSKNTTGSNSFGREENLGEMVDLSSSGEKEKEERLSADQPNVRLDNNRDYDIGREKRLQVKIWTSSERTKSKTAAFMKEKRGNFFLL